MDVLDPGDSMEICVTKCPKQMLYTKADVKKFAEETGSHLCLYDVPVEDYENLDDSKWSKKGPCPELPVFARYVASLHSNCLCTEV